MNIGERDGIAMSGKSGCGCACACGTSQDSSGGSQSLTLERMIDAYEGWLFDLDGVVTDTASVHARAWKAAFDSYLHVVAERTNTPFVPFALDTDYHAYVDGKPRYEGVDCFLRTRNIVLPWGTPEDSAEAETVCGIGNRKNLDFNQILSDSGVYVFPATRRLLDVLQSKHKKIALVTSSKNGDTVLEYAGIGSYFPVRVDGTYAAKNQLKGKPAPDTFLEAARLLDVSPAQSVVLEDAVSGVQAGRAGGFGLVLGIARHGEPESLLSHGADHVVSDLEEIFM